MTNFSVNGRFSFGENWSEFLEGLNENRIEKAKSELQSRFGREDLNGCTFLDAGCGSGLFSLAAVRLGADEVVSFDYDPDSVACCRRLKEREGVQNWTVEQGNLLDDEYMSELGSFELVYCWGVAHHTGEMWSAIENVLNTVDSGGQLCLGIYNYADKGVQTTDRWKKIKRLYVPMPKPIQELMVYGYGLTFLLYRWFSFGEHPVRRIRNHGEARGMEFWTGARDWVGGYPYEAATPEEVEEFVVSQSDDISLIEAETPTPCSPSAVNTFVFKKSG